MLHAQMLLLTYLMAGTKQEVVEWQEVEETTNIQRYRDSLEQQPTQTQQSNFIVN